MRITAKKLPKLLKISIAIAVYVATVFSVSMFWQQPNLVLGISVLLAVIIIALEPKQETFTAFILGGLLGSLTETICIYFGAWSYASPQFLGIPLWLPIVWGIAAVIITRGVAKLLR
ncbi:MAG: hypothetical protein WC304_01620 [Candidatus Gracilibacteria bacterium]|jgi:hypothetical protein